MTSPSFSDRDQALREQMAGPNDQSEFWRRQRELTLGRIETPEPIKFRPPLWMWMVAIPLAGVAVISVLRVI